MTHCYTQILFDIQSGKTDIHCIAIFRFDLSLLLPVVWRFLLNNRYNYQGYIFTARKYRLSIDYQVFA